MSIEINLLPWREQQRARRSRRFQLAIVLMAALGVAAGLGVTHHYQEGRDAQQQRNAHIREQMQRLDRDIQSIGEYEAIRERMIGQVEVFSELQQGRSQTVQVLRDLTTSLVDGVHYTQLSRQDDRLRLSGLAESNRRVSDQLRALAAAPSLAEPVLSEVETDQGARRRFSLSVMQLAPSDAGEADASPEDSAQEVP
ncbi:fimbrial assembly protein [Halomonas campisalis]|uniref:Fimbrial assembly protein n=1 Tax=Billgrantia campisalis TaxID=74661 RepID=A0ABS9P9E1_9GAMM|nr:PilN domain-containing protein [Halomonas campisalis]MCG6658378.1 fimbrial assembly protein [Halomonas campisalis]MDR5863049.1 PilN domain-containing protein [Halomonas campisalis]